MSTCISKHGEFSAHTLGEGENEFTCTLCWVEDADAMRAALAEVTASLRYSESARDIMRREKEHGWAEADRMETQRDTALAELAALRAASGQAGWWCTQHRHGDRFGGEWCTLPAHRPGSFSEQAEPRKEEPKRSDWIDRSRKAAAERFGALPKHYRPVVVRPVIPAAAPVGGQAEPSDDDDPESELLSISGNREGSTAKCQLCDEPHVGYIFGGPDKIGHYCRVHLVTQTRYWAGIWAANGATGIPAAAVSGEQATPPSGEQR